VEGAATTGGARTTARPRLALYWGAGCGGCEVAVCNLHEGLLDLDRAFELWFCPCLVDTKRSDGEAIGDGAIFATLFDGALRTEENLEMARLLRRKSRLLVAFGSCAVEGCVPGLGNLVDAPESLRRIYEDTPTAEPGAAPPRTRTPVLGGAATLELPALLPRVVPLGEVVEVDYVVPGCPPEPPQIRAVIAALAAGHADARSLPPRGSVLGAGRSTVCDECARTREDKAIERLYRTYELAPDGSRCLLDQGLVCVGPATRDGFGALCPRVDAPCTGCYGAPEGVRDAGARMATAIGSALSLAPLHAAAEGAPMDAAADARLDAIPDWLGTLYRHGLATSVLGRRPGRRDPGTGGAP
jgi:F420-non-reducing hydrogenase small subunit